jgi:hypothetical protein
MKENTINKNSIPKVNINAKDLIFTLLFLLAFILVFYADYFIKLANTSSSQLDETRKISKQIAELSLSIDSISLNTDVLRSGFLKSIRPLPIFGLDTQSALIFGKANPFSGNYITVSTTSNIEGGIRYTTQTATGTRSIITVPQTR